MCLLVFAWNRHPRYRLVLAGNRDEFHERPTAALHWWSGETAVLAGRDLRAQGTWLGFARNGRFGIVTNFREAVSPPPAGAPSRGALVPEFLQAATTPGRYLDALRPDASRYGGFNLLIGEARELHYFSNRGDGGPRELPPGIYGLSNHWLDTPWPKLARARARFEAALEGGDAPAEELFAILADRTVAGDAPRSGLPEDWERAVSAPFVVHDRYGTRCSTVVHVEHGGRTTVHERRFGVAGELTGASRFAFASDAGDRAAPSAGAAPLAVQPADAAFEPSPE